MQSDSAETPPAPDADKPVVSTRTMEIAVSAAFFLVGALVMWDSVRLGHRWAEGGPEAGYFPFYISLIMLIASATNGLAAAFTKKGRAAGAKPFVTWGQFRPVLAVFFPLALYVLGMQYLGLYVSAALFIGLFMRINGKYGLKRILPVSLSVPVVVYLMFELWFLVPLPKGPVEAMLGL
jgi:putative tricarboxylic transport membrane protein